MSDKAFELHECNLQPNNVYIIHDDQLDENGCWYMQITRQVTEEDLEENSYFEALDDIAWQTLVEVHNCPYCGFKLLETQQQSEQWQAKMIHSDFSR